MITAPASDFERRVLAIFPHARIRPGSPWASVRCPFHGPDRSPSASINVKSGTFRCHGCGSGFRFRELLAELGIPAERRVADGAEDRRDLPGRLGAVEAAPDLDALSARAAAYLARRPDLVRALEERFGVATVELERRGIGAVPAGRALGEACGEERPRWRPEMFLLPARSADGSRVEAIVPRLVEGFSKVGANRPRGLTRAALLGLEDLAFRPDARVVIAAGERDWLSFMAHLRTVVPISATTGEATSLRRWLEHFRGRSVVVCYDSDNAGRAAARARADELLEVDADVRVIDLFPVVTGAA